MDAPLLIPMADAEDDRSTVLDEEDGPNGAVAMHPLGARSTAADDAALCEAACDFIMATGKCSDNDTCV